MRTFRKRMLSGFLLILSLTFILWGCSSAPQGSQKPASAPAAGGNAGASTESKEKVELTWLVRTDPTMINWEQQMIKEFQVVHPNITVNLERIPQAEMDQRLTTMIASGKVPDVFCSNWANSGFATYKKMGALLDLTPYVQRDATQLATINKDVMNVYKVDGKYYGVPMLSIGSFIYYNKDLFDQAHIPYPPVSWDDQTWNYDKLMEYAQKLTHDVGNAEKQVFGVYVSEPINRYVWGFGGDFFKPEAYTSNVMGEPNILNDPRNKEALQYYVDLITKYKVSPNQTAVDAMNAIGNPFLTGKVAMAISAGSGFWTYQSAKFKWGVAPIPYHDGRKDAIYVDPWHVTAKSKHPEESWEFIKFLINPQNGGKTFMEQTLATPADTTLAEQWYKLMADKTGMKAEDIKSLHENAIKNGREADNHLIEKYSAIQNTMNQTLTGVYNGQKSLDDGMKEIDAKLRGLNLN